MKNSVMLTVSSLLSILLLTIHLSTEIAYRLEPGSVKNITGVLILVVWLCGTLLLAERRLGYVIVLLGSLLGSGVPVLHMMGSGLVGGKIGASSGAIFWVWSNLALCANSIFSVILAVRGLWSLQRSKSR